MNGLYMIDVSSNELSKISDLYPYDNCNMGLNRKTNEIYLPSKYSFSTYNISTKKVEEFNFPTGAWYPLEIAINEVENKVYFMMIFMPGQSEGGICIFNRNSNTFLFRGADDLEPLAFNNESNNLFSGVQIGTKTCLIDGKTDELTYFSLEWGEYGHEAISIRNSTDHAYILSTDYTIVIDGKEKKIKKKIRSGYSALYGDHSISCISINQSTGRVYVVNSGKMGKISIFQD